MNGKVKNMVGIGVFTAIVVVLQLFGGGTTLYITLAIIAFLLSDIS